MKQNSCIVYFSLLIVFLLVFLICLSKPHFFVESYNDRNTIATPPNKSAIHYSSDNYNVEYHDDVSAIAAQTGIYNGDSGIAWVSDATGKKIGLPKLKGQENITYHPPGYYKYGASNYVPSYEDSIYLSKTYRNKK